MSPENQPAVEPTHGAGLRQSHFGSGYDAGKARLQAEVSKLKEQIAAMESSRDPEQGVRAYPIEAEEALTAWMASRTEGVWTSPAGWWYAAWMHRQVEVEQMKAQLAAQTLPIRMILICWACDNQHIDRDEWATRPHKTHLCEHCGAEWRPSNTATVGVERLDAADVPADSTTREEQG